MFACHSRSVCIMFVKGADDVSCLHERVRRGMLIHTVFPHIDFIWAGRPGILTAAQVYLVTFLFLLLLLSLTFFLISTR